MTDLAEEAERIYRRKESIIDVYSDDQVFSYLYGNGQKSSSNIDEIAVNIIDLRNQKLILQVQPEINNLGSVEDLERVRDRIDDIKIVEVREQLNQTLSRTTSSFDRAILEASRTLVEEGKLDEEVSSLEEYNNLDGRTKTLIGNEIRRM